MSSSTSNSESAAAKAGDCGRSFRRAALAVLCFFVAMEVVTRVQFFHMSKDFRRFGTYARRAAELTAAPGASVALIGNSSTDLGVDTDLLKRGFAAGGLQARADKFVADSAHIDTWYYMANRYFWSAGRSPRVMVVTYFDTSLQDGNQLEIGRLAQFFTTPRDWRDVMRELPDTGARLDYAVSTVWATYAVRERVQERVLTLVVPKYKEFLRVLHRDNQPAALDNERPAPGTDVAAAEAARLRAFVPGKRSYRMVERFLAAARAHGTKVCFVAFPMKKLTYAIDPELPRVVKAGGGEFLDLQHLPGMEASLYDDPIHLNEKGRAYYTARLARVLSPVVRGAGKGD